jgi:hypothetical protein
MKVDIEGADLQTLHSITPATALAYVSLELNSAGWILERLLDEILCLQVRERRHPLARAPNIRSPDRLAALRNARDQNRISRQAETWTKPRRIAAKVERHGVNGEIIYSLKKHRS